MSTEVTLFSKAACRGLARVFNLEPRQLEIVARGAQEFFQGSEARRCIEESKEALETIQQLGGALHSIEQRGTEIEQREAAAQKGLGQAAKDRKAVEQEREEQDAAHQTTRQELLQQHQEAHAALLNSAAILQNPLVSQGVRSTVKIGRFSLPAAAALVSYFRQGFLADHCARGAMQCVSSVFDSSIYLPVLIGAAASYLCYRGTRAAVQFEERQRAVDTAAENIRREEIAHRDNMTGLQTRLQEVEDTDAGHRTTLGQATEDRRALRQEEGVLQGQIARIQNAAHTKIVQSQIKIIDTALKSDLQEIGFEAIRTILNTGVAEAANRVGQEGLAAIGSSSHRAITEEL